MVTVGEQIDVEPEELPEIILSERDEVLVWLGRVQATDRIAETLRGEMLRALIAVEEQKKYKRLGFKTFAEFLEKSDLSPLTRNQYYDRRKLLDKEGEKLFDLYPSIGISMRTRKLLGEGNVSYDGENLTVRNGNLELTYHRDDFNRAAEIITAIADSRADTTRKLEKTELALDKAMDDNADLKKKIEDVKASKYGDAGNAADRALIVAISSVTGLAKESAALSTADKRQFGPAMLERLAGAMSELAAALDAGDWTNFAPANPVVSKDPEVAHIENLFASAADMPDDEE